MKIKKFLLIALLIPGHQFCFGQEIPNSNPLEPKPPLEYKIASIQRYYVFKADDKSFGMLSTSIAENDFDLNSIENLISKLEVIKGKNATIKYGILGANGVIVITFKDYASLPQELKEKFKNSE